MATKQEPKVKQPSTIDEPSRKAAMLAACEFGFKCAERGMNLEATREKFLTIFEK